MTTALTTTTNDQCCLQSSRQCGWTEMPKSLAKPFQEKASRNKPTATAATTTTSIIFQINTFI